MCNAVNHKLHGNRAQNHTHKTHHNLRSVASDSVKNIPRTDQYRTDDTLLVDAGDTIQDNCADICVGDDDIHPMVRAVNALNYDV